MFDADPKLIDASLAVIRRGQTREGAYLACPDYPTYCYSWFRDGAFIAEAMDAWQERESAAAFHAWVLRTLAARFARMPEPAPGRVPPEDRILHTRYRPDGAPGRDGWPNFQLDGFGTWLWAYARHVRRHGAPPDGEQRRTLARLVRYLGNLWDQPNYDCWEEHPDRVHPATLGALVAGLRGAAELLAQPEVGDTAEQVRTHLLRRGTADGAFVKHVGSTAVDANLLWLSVPYQVVPADDPLARRTAERVRRELTDAEGGVKRYAADTFYGGGSWLLLTAAAARDAATVNEMDRAYAAMRWIEAQADDEGRMPEQVSRHLNEPEAYQGWVDLWGPVAKPLLWSHAAYLSAVAQLRTS